MVINNGDYSISIVFLHISFSLGLHNVIQIICAYIF